MHIHVVFVQCLISRKGKTNNQTNTRESGRETERERKREKEREKETDREREKENFFPNFNKSTTQRILVWARAVMKKEMPYYM